MKKLTFTLVLILNCISLFAQSAFYDAQFVADWVANDTIDVVLSYGVKTPNGGESQVDSRFTSKLELLIEGHKITAQAERDKVSSPDPKIQFPQEEFNQLQELKKFINNPFDPAIKIDFNTIYKAITRGNEIIGKMKAKGVGFFGPGTLGILSSIPTMISGFGNLNAQQQTAIYDGITKYVTQEFKEGATNAYMELFENHLDKIGELKLFFPETYDMIKKRDPFTFPDLGNEWKTPFSKDLQNIPSQLLNQLEYPSTCSNCKFLTDERITRIKSEDNYKYFKIGVDISDKIIKGYHPVNLLNHLDRTYASDDSYGRIGELLKGLNLIQTNLRDTCKAINGQLDNVWIGFEQLKQLNTPQEWRYFFGIIYQQDKVFFQRIFGSPSLISNWEKEIFNKKILPVYAILLEIQEFARTQDLEKRDFRSFLGLLTKTISTVNKISFNDASISEAIKVIENCTDMYISIKEQNYNTLIQHITGIIELLLNRATLNPDENIELSRFIFALNRFGQFAVAVVNSKDSDELKGVIKNYAAPPNTYSKKRNSIWGLAINSHPGFYGSREILDENNEEWKTNIGLSLPIGLELYTGVGKKGSNNRYNIFVKNNKERQLTGISLSLFFHIIDLGAILNYRWTDSESKLPDDIDFKDVFSPGIILNIGLKNTPITLGAGYQYAPKLREITSGGNTLVPNAHRVQFKVTWDIPFVNIINRKPENVNQK